jgi:hypothetical protein
MCKNLRRVPEYPPRLAPKLWVIVWVPSHDFTTGVWHTRVEHDLLNGVHPLLLKFF